MKSWQRDRAMSDHIEDHLSTLTWPSECPILCCKVKASEREPLLYHLKNVHALDIPSGPNSKGSKFSIVSEDNPGLKRKRKWASADTVHPLDTIKPRNHIVSLNNSESPLAKHLTLPVLPTEMDYSTIDLPDSPVSEGTSMKAEGDSGPLLDASYISNEDELFSQFIQLHTSNEDDQLTDKENTGNCPSKNQDSLQIAEDSRPNKQFRLILRVRPPDDGQTSSKNCQPSTRKQSKQRKAPKTSSRMATRSMELPRVKLRLSFGKAKA